VAFSGSGLLCQHRKLEEENGKNHEKEMMMELGEENVLILAREDE